MARAVHLVQDEVHRVQEEVHQVPAEEVQVELGLEVAAQGVAALGGAAHVDPVVEDDAFSSPSLLFLLPSTFFFFAFLSVRSAPECIEGFLQISPY